MDPMPGLGMMEALWNVTEETRKAMVDELKADAIRILAEVALNVILGTIPSDPGQLEELRRHKKDLVALTRTKASVEDRRKRLKRSGLLKSVLDVALA